MDIHVPRLADYLDEWLERRRARLRPSTHRSYRQLIGSYLTFTLGDRRGDQLNRRAIERTYAELFRRVGYRGGRWPPRRCSTATRRCGVPWRTRASTGSSTSTRPTGRVHRSELLGLRWQDVDLELAHVRLRRGLTVVDGVPRLMGTETSRPLVVSIATSVVEAMVRHRDVQDGLRASASDWHDR